MSTFQQLIDNIKEPVQHKEERIKCIHEIEGLTERPLIVYAANTRRGGNIPNAIDDTDITGFSDLIEDIDGDKIDVLLHSPGGSAESTERIVNLLRSNFSHVRFLIPNSAYSAATMLALCGDEILMDERSTLGPIDPQIMIFTRQGVNSVPVQDIIDGFARIRKTLSEDPESLPVYLPMLEKYDLHIFETCENAKVLASSLARDWLERFMLKDTSDKAEKAKMISTRLAAHDEYLSHARTININRCKELGLIIQDLRDNLPLRSLLWKLYCLIELFFDRSPAVKLFENSHGVSWQRSFHEQIVQIPVPVPRQPPELGKPSNP